MAWPSHMAPPLRGAGLVQLLVLFWKPFPQRLLHTDHSVHVDQPPFTTTAKQEPKSLTWINFKCLAVTKSLPFATHYAFFSSGENRKRRQRMFSVAVAIYVQLLRLLRQWQKSISLITVRETAAGKHIAALDF